MHEQPASVSVYLTDVDQRFTGEDGDIRRETSLTRAASSARRRTLHKPLELVLIELKPGAPQLIAAARSGQARSGKTRPQAPHCRSRKRSAYA